jgi:protein phosphatase
MLTAHGFSHVGRVRQSNEDSWLVDNDLGLYIVADGMGGHNAGEVASKMAVDVMRAFLARTRDGEDVTWPFGLNPQHSFHANRLTTALRIANRRVFKVSESRGDYTGMGTTVVAVLIEGDNAVYASVGDSRLYLFRSGQLTQLTRDDSWIATVLAANPEVDRKSLASHPMRHVLTNVLGARDELDAAPAELQLSAGDQLLICSDGLYNGLDESAMADILAAEPDVNRATVRLVETSVERSGSDNTTAVLIRVAS